MQKNMCMDMLCQTHTEEREGRGVGMEPVRSLHNSTHQMNKSIHQSCDKEKCVSTALSIERERHGLIICALKPGTSGFCSALTLPPLLSGAHLMTPLSEFVHL